MNSICAQVENLSFSYCNKNLKKEKSVLSKINFAVYKNEIVGLLGRNGVGKTTLLNIIAGFIKGYSGNVVIDGINIDSLTLKSRAKTISYIQQNGMKIPDYYTIEDFVIEGLRPFRNFGMYKPCDWERLDEVLASCDLTSFRGKLIAECSGGEIQRCIFAQAIIKNAKLFLFDEPNSALDIKYKQDFFELVKKLKNSDNAIVIAMHDINLAMKYCDRVIVLLDGKILYDGSISAITSNILSEAFNILVYDFPQSNKFFYY